MAGRLAAGVWDREQMDGSETAIRTGLLGSAPGVLCSITKGLVIIAAAVGPCQLQERALGKGCRRVESPSSDCLCPATLPLPAFPSHRGGQQQGVTAHPGSLKEGTRLEGGKETLGPELNEDI